LDESVYFSTPAPAIIIKNKSNSDNLINNSCKFSNFIYRNDLYPYFNNTSSNNFSPSIIKNIKSKSKNCISNTNKNIIFTNRKDDSIKYTTFIKEKSVLSSISLEKNDDINISNIQKIENLVLNNNSSEINQKERNSNITLYKDEFEVKMEIDQINITKSNKIIGIKRNYSMMNEIGNLGNFDIQSKIDYKKIIGFQEFPIKKFLFYSNGDKYFNNKNNYKLNP